MATEKILQLTELQQKLDSIFISKCKQGECIVLIHWGDIPSAVISSYLRNFELNIILLRCNLMQDDWVTHYISAFNTARKNNCKKIVIAFTNLVKDEKALLDLMQALNALYKTKIKFYNPLAALSIVDQLRLHADCDEPENLGYIRSCHDFRYGGFVHCGCCSICFDRAQAFIEAKTIDKRIVDPTVYANNPLQSGVKKVKLPNAKDIFRKKKKHAIAKT